MCCMGFLLIYGTLLVRLMGCTANGFTLHKNIRTVWNNKSLVEDDKNSRAAFLFAVCNQVRYSIELCQKIKYEEIKTATLCEMTSMFVHFGKSTGCSYMYDYN